MKKHIKSVLSVRRVAAIILTLILVLQFLPSGLFAANGRPLSPIASVEEDASYDKSNTKTFLLQTTYGEKVRVVFYKNDMFRIWLADGATGNFSEGDSYLLLDKEDFGSMPEVVHSYNSEDPLNAYHAFTSAEVELRAYVDPFHFAMYRNGQKVWEEYTPITYDTNAVTQLMATDATEYFYGGGMQMGSLSHKGSKINIARSGWTPGTAPSPVPFYMSTKGYGVFRNTFQNGAYDFTSNAATEHTHNESRFDAFYFNGSSFGAVLDGYTELTGRPSLIPRWGLGLGDASAYRQGTDTTAEGGNPKDSSSYTSGQEPYGGFWRDNATVGVAGDVVSDYIDKDMPIAWMLPNDGYGCEYNKATHPGGSLGDASAGLMQYNVRTGLWVGQPQNYTQRSYTYGDGTDTGFQKEIEAQVRDWGVRLYKIDVAWSSQYNLKGDMERIFQRMYNNLENVGERGYLITVYGWAGGQRYATIWSGDQSGTDDYVQYHIPSITGASMSGYAYATSDQAAIFTDNPNVYVRDLQMKTLVPTNYVMNNWGGVNSAGTNTANKRPGADRFTEEEQEINRKYLKLHMQLVPYIYSYARQAFDTGAPIVRPMVYNYQNDPVTYDDKTQYQYMSGDWLLAAPVYNPKSTVRDNIYLPEGRWIDYWTGEEYFGPTTVVKDAPLDTLPMFVRGGAIVPMQQECLYDGQQEYNGKVVNDTIILDMYPEGETSFTLYEDDGHSTKYKTENAYTNTVITSKAPQAGWQGPLEVTIGAAEGNPYEGQVASRKNLLTIHTQIKPGSVKLDGVDLPELGSYEAVDGTEEGGWYYNSDEKSGVLYVKTPSLAISSEKTIVIDDYITNAAPERETALPLAENVLATGVSDTQMRIDWDEVPGANSYEIQVDDLTIIENVTPGFIHNGLEPETAYTYRVRARTATQRSGWTNAVVGVTQEDPDKYLVPKSEMSVAWNKGVWSYNYASYIIDGDVGSMFHSSSATSAVENLDFDLGEMYLVDRFKYMPRPDKGNGTVRGYKLFTSTDGEHYTEVASGTWSWAGENGMETTREVTFEPTMATHLRFQKVTSAGNFFSGQEIYVYRSRQDFYMHSLATGKDTTASSVWTPPASMGNLDKITGLTANAENYESAGGFMPSLAVDNNPDTVWKMREGSSCPAEISLYLPQADTVCSVKYTPPQPGQAGAVGNVTGFAVYATLPNNQKVWLAGGEWEDDGEPKTVHFRPINASSIQFVVTSAVGGLGAAAEIELYKEHADYKQELVDRTELTATASSTGGQSTPVEVPAPNAIDGNTGTFHETTYQAANWNTGHWPAYFTIDLGKPRVISKIEYAARTNGSGALRGYDVYYSTDGENYYLGGEGVAPNEARNGNYVELDFDYRYPVRYVRIASALKLSLVGEPIVAHSNSGATAFAWNVGNHITASDIRFYEDPEKTEANETDPVEIAPIPYEELTATTNREVDGENNAANAVDGNPETYWASENGTENWDTDKWPASLTIDLGKARRINKIEYTPRGDSSDGRLRGYDVYVSTDGGETFFFASTGYGWDVNSVQNIVFNYEKPVTHIRIQNAVFGEMATRLDTTSAPEAGSGAYAYGSGTQLAIGDLKFFEDPSEYTGDEFGPEPTCAAKYATDESLETGWSSENGPTASLVVDLGETKPLDYARIVWGREVGRNFTIDKSDDGVNWETMKTVSNNTKSSSYYKLDNVYSGRYVRLNGTGAETGYTVRSFDIFGDDTVTDVLLDKTSADLRVGDTLAISGTILPYTARNHAIVWSSSNPEVASVDEISGLVVAKKEGEAIITATALTNDAVQATCSVTVSNVPVEGISLNATGKVMALEEMAQLEADVTPANATNKTVTWVSDNTEVAEVDEYGFVTAKKLGKATITATSADNEAVSATFDVTVTDITGFTLNNETGEITVAFEELPTNVLKILFNITYQYAGGEESTLAIRNMLVDTDTNTVTFAYNPFETQEISAEVTVKVQYKAGQTLRETISLIDVNKDALQALYDANKDKQNEEYTEESWGTFQDALAEAKRVLEKTGATQSEVDAATEELQAAIDGLVQEGAIEVENVKINLGVLTNLKRGKETKLSVTINPEDATNKTISWSSSNPNVLTVNEEGVVLGVKPGTVRVTATAHNGVSHTVTIRVTS